MMAPAPVGWLAGALPAQATSSARTAPGLAKRRRTSPVSIVGILFLGFLSRERRRLGFDQPFERRGTVLGPVSGAASEQVIAGWGAKQVGDMPGNDALAKVAQHEAPVRRALTRRAILQVLDADGRARAPAGPRGAKL